MFELKLGKAVTLLTEAREALSLCEPKEKSSLASHRALVVKIDALIVDCER